MSSEKIDLWGGLECTIARLGDGFRNQLAETGHMRRTGDLARVAGLGIRKLRYPLLWEAISPETPEQTDFSWHDRQIADMRALGIEVIAGLCHHGSGPGYTDMRDPLWPELLARHARHVASRYPHIRDYTPVNEPLTTARFCGLYGVWYPHERSEGAFLRILFAECKATLLAMRAIRQVRPDARLIQTDDLGKTFSTPRLSYQAAYENERRWLSFDLLCGRVTREHPWYQRFLDHGVADAELALLAGGEATPDIIGINHYLTSERWLDEHVERYPVHLHGGNGCDVYADAEAVRMPIPHDDLGPAARLMEAWQRYGLPLAVTEVHHGCTRDDQLRWLMEVWRAAEQVKAQGADLRAVTVWALFGTQDWNSLLTRAEGFYEPGPFDVRGDGAPRETVLAQAVRALSRRGRFEHPALDRAGWWKRSSRFYDHVQPRDTVCQLVPRPRRLLIVGRNAMATAIRRVADARGLDHIASEGARNERHWAVIDARSDSEIVVTHRHELTIRTGLRVDPWCERDPVLALLRAAGRGQPLSVPDGVFRLSYVPDVAHELLNLLLDGASGEWSLANRGLMSAGRLVRRLLPQAGIVPHDRIVLQPALIPVPESSHMPFADNALARFLHDCAFSWNGDELRIAAE